MFTGIVEEIGKVEAIREGGLTISGSVVMDDLQPGGSISVNGACLTVTTLGGQSFLVDIVPETLRRTNLGSLEIGDPVNLERPMTIDGRFDGHMVQGHVDGIGVVESITVDRDALLISIGAAPSIMRFVVEKGFIAVDGISLTIVHCDDRSFSASVIPSTRDNTVLGSRSVADRVNLEVDVIAKYVDRMVAFDNRIRKN